MKIYMKISRLILLLLSVLLLSSCRIHIDGQAQLPPESDESAAEVTETVDASADETVPERSGAESDTESITESTQSPYGIFTYAAEEAPELALSSHHAILIDAATNEILCLAGDPFDRIYPASVTKLLTILVAMEHCPDLTAVFTPGNELSLIAKDNSIAFIEPNDRLTLEMLIEGMLLPSGGDAAYMAAAGVGRIIAGNSELSGTEAAAVFVEEMNRYAEEELGLTGSHFTNPDGYFDAGHYTTLCDIMTIARRAMDDPVIMKYAGLHCDKLRDAGGKVKVWVNSNEMLDPKSPYYSPYVSGLKTGTLKAAGNCLVSTAEKDGTHLLIGVFGAENNGARYTDTLALLEIGLGE